MKSRISSWASFFTLGGMSPLTCVWGEGSKAKGPPARAVALRGAHAAMGSAWTSLQPPSQWLCGRGLQGLTTGFPCISDSSCGNGG